MPARVELVRACDDPPARRPYRHQRETVLRRHTDVAEVQVLP